MPTDGEATVSVDHLGGGRAGLSLNGESLSGGISKIAITESSHELLLDRLRVTPSHGALKSTVHQAEDGTPSGAAKVTDACSFAFGGKGVTDIGDGKAHPILQRRTGAGHPLQPRPHLDGDTHNRYDQRSPYAPVIDRITVTPLTQSSPQTFLGAR